MRVTEWYFSLICSCRVFQARETTCWRAVFHMRLSKVFHGAFYKNKQSNSLPVCIFLLYFCLKNISFRYQPVWVYVFSPVHIQNENSPKLIMDFFFFCIFYFPLFLAPSLKYINVPRSPLSQIIFSLAKTLLFLTVTYHSSISWKSILSGFRLFLPFTRSSLSTIFWLLLLQN